MAASSTPQMISDDLLDIMVRIRQEAGVSHAQVQGVIDRFACRDQWNERSGGIGFPLIEDVPQQRRSEFMAALSDLIPDRQPLRVEGRVLTAADVWPARVVD